MRSRKGCGIPLAKGDGIPKARILVVDDEANARAALRTILSEEGYEIAEAPDGEAGLASLTELAPDVVLADVRMPRMDGLTFLRKAKESRQTAQFLRSLLQ
jgi:CheY-like chemotaxis protein